MFMWMMFGMITPQVFWAHPPEDSKLYLLDSVIYPIELHIHGLWFLLKKNLCCVTHCCGIVNLNICGSLFSPLSSQGGADRYSCLCVNEYGAIFHFSCWHHDVAHDFAHRYYDAVDSGYKILWIFGVMWTFTEKMDPTGRLLAWETER